MKFDLIDLKAYWSVEFPTIKNLRFVKTILLKKQLNKAIIYRRGIRHKQHEQDVSMLFSNFLNLTNAS